MLVHTHEYSTIFKESVIGTNLKNPLLVIFNKIKDSGEIPKFMRKANVVTITKKGPKVKLENKRGIFLVNTVRGILMRLLFNLKYQMLNSHMSDSNVGGRRGKSGINHIWVMNSILHDTLASVKKPGIVVTKYDYKQMFDSMDSKESCGDLFDYGVNDDYLNLIHKANKEVVISVKTPTGNSKEYELTNTIMQGDTWAPI